MKRYAVVFSICISTVLFETVYASVMSGIIAYPVPYNPRRGVLRVEDRSGVLSGAIRVGLNIYDINGDPIFSRNYPSFSNVFWNGRNTNGTRVRPGLYIIRVEVEDINGFYGTKTIRILINY